MNTRKRHIGIIAKSQKDGEYFLHTCHSPFDVKFYILSRPNDPRGLRLDAVLCTKESYKNTHFMEIVENSEFCLL